VVVLFCALLFPPLVNIGLICVDFLATDTDTAAFLATAGAGDLSNLGAAPMPILYTSNISYSNKYR
jgi:hypothetical protein